MSKIKSGQKIFLAALFYYLFLPNKDQGFDSYLYALDIRNGVELLNPHHLVYNIVGRMLFRVFEFTGLGTLKLLSVANSVAAAFVIAIVFVIIRKKLSTLPALAGSITIATICSFWYYATSLEVNMPAILFLSFALYFALTKGPSAFNTAWIFLFLGAGTLFHQIIVLCFIPFFLYEIYRFHSIKKPCMYALPGAGMVAVVYIIAAVSQASEKTVRGIYYWLTLYSHSGTWGNLQLDNIVTSAWGITKSFLGGETIRELLYEGKISYMLVLYVIMAIAFMAAVLVVLIRAINSGLRHDKGACWLLLSLIGIFSLFAFWWAPTDEGFWLYPAFIVILFVFSFGNTTKRLGFSIAVLLILINIPFEIAPAAADKHSIVLQGAESLRRQNITSNDLVLTNLLQIRLALEYYHNLKVKTANLVDLHKETPALAAKQIGRQIRETRKTGRIFVFENEFNPEPHRRYLTEHFSAQDYVKIYEPYKPFLKQVDSISAFGKTVKIFEIVEADSMVTDTGSIIR